MLLKIVEKLIIRLFDFLAQNASQLRTRVLRVRRLIAEGVGRGRSNLTIAMLKLQPHGAEQLAKQPT